LDIGIAIDDKSQGILAIATLVVGSLTAKLLQTTAECTLNNLVNWSTFDQVLGKKVYCLIAVCIAAMSC